MNPVPQDDSVSPTARSSARPIPGRNPMVDDAIAQSLPPRAPMLSSSPAPTAQHFPTAITLPPPSPPVRMEEFAAPSVEVLGRSMLRHELISSSAPSGYAHMRHYPHTMQPLPPTSESNASSSVASSEASAPGSATAFSLLSNDEHLNPFGTEELADTLDDLQIGQEGQRKGPPVIPLEEFPAQVESPRPPDSEFAFLDELEP
eukprot:GFYU01006286.1.p1 GENE.GFYU01006286.1~~GFYU01006286.1.p1  ORF type:complete len:203 (-),score=19.55 GFYU01006286.1:950-1558(-)